MSTSKSDVRDFWNEASCGEKLYLGGVDAAGFDEQAQTRYALEPFIIPFADFPAAVSSKAAARSPVRRNLIIFMFLPSDRAGWTRADLTTGVVAAGCMIAA